MDSLLLVLRVGLSLAAVLGLLWWLSRRMQARVGVKRRESLNILGRQQLSRRSGVALIEAAGHRIVVGYGDEGVTFLHDAGEMPEEAPAAVPAARVEVDLADVDATGAAPREATISELRVPDASARPVAPVHVRSTPARTADARRHRSPLEGSILAPDTWRKAVATVQERTVRRP
ncbi:flagellar biosynthetic protein FliO [Demequina capsici]|uniref:Flagellar biosynthetic protein FliO n=1 Tax=Demequina capsici TaxID=3075620 RepID=A0AA96FF40_9MICO|nr:flagellar biosynthetic protein FliO [Demequina sp. PMTSA13]WNM27416.1 flagellar biosynthetic protein FliO [Demequina sp. PMTSA13]